MKKLFLLFLFAAEITMTFGQEIKVATLNIWSGLDYDGMLKMGEYESHEIREKRFDTLVDELNKLQPDIIFLQEVNPAGYLSEKLANVLDYEEIHQVCNAGIKFGPLGLPVNLKEGNTILARKQYNLEEVDVLKLSGGFGLHGDVISIHFNDAIFAQIAKLIIENREIYLINTHLSASSDVEGTARRKQEIKLLLDYTDNNMKDVPVIFGGDLNATPETEEIRLLTEKGYFIDCFYNNSEPGYTWDPLKNSNTSYSVNTNSLDAAAIRDSEYDRKARRIDYLFVNNIIGKESIKKASLAFDQNKVQPVSDHFGVYSIISLEKIPVINYDLVKPDWDALPILSYDTDFGLGAGFKAFLLNQIGYKESMDFTLYYSSKGERWYHFAFSLPDFEVRQRTVYPAAFDLIADYDRMNKSSFFGIGSESDFDDREFYTREPFELKLQYSRGFTQSLVMQSGLKYKYVRNLNFEDNSRISEAGGLNSSRSSYYGLYTGLRFDSRNSFINPSRGAVIEGEAEYVPNLSINSVSFERIMLNVQYFRRLFYPQTTFAARVLLQGLIGDNIPIQNLLSIGGNNTLRGYPQDRFMDKLTAVVNAEIRFPIIWRFGGVAGVDAGNVWHEPDKLSLKDWKINPSTGLRFYFDTFIVRLDLGFSSEATGFYLNFGHIF